MPILLCLLQGPLSYIDKKVILFYNKFEHHKSSQEDRNLGVGSYVLLAVHL
jgi:hypothetical protein